MGNIETATEKLEEWQKGEMLTAEQKEKLLSRRVELNEEINEIENGSVSWLEPARAFVKSLNQAEKLLSSGDKSEMTTFLKQIGSNHILLDKSFSFSPKNQYKLAAERSEAASSGLRNSNWRDTRVKYPRMSIL